METAITGAISGMVGAAIGFIVGYYKSRAEFTEKLAKMMTRTDCVNCDLRKDVVAITSDMRAGNEAFKAIREDISQIRQDIAAMRGRQ